MMFLMELGGYGDGVGGGKRGCRWRVVMGGGWKKGCLS